jgi:hypothetical protein
MPAVSSLKVTERFRASREFLDSTTASIRLGEAESNSPHMRRTLGMDGISSLAVSEEITGADSSRPAAYAPEPGGT